MAQPELIEVVGAVRSGACGCDSLQEVMSLGCCVAYGASKGARPSINAPSPGTPFSIPLEGITKVRFICLRIKSGGSFLLHVTTPNGGAQVLPVSQLLVLHNPSAGDQVTALSINGVGDIEYFLAGEAT